MLDGNPVDEQHVVASLERHKQTFGHVPKLYGSDRGFFSEKNVMSCKQEGVKVVCIPQRGGTKTPEREAYEKTREFKDGQRFRAGIEGRISVLFRGRGMKRCLAQGRERFELWVAAAVLANNLMKSLPCWRTDHRADEKPPDNIPSSHFVCRGTISAVLSCNDPPPYGRLVKSRRKSASKCTANASIRRQFTLVLLGKWHASVQKQTFRDRN